jgi:DtxR family Mn-dependent transcriptional regulator
MKDDKLSPNMEMYLKTILRLGHDTPAVRVKAIAESLGVTMPSVSEALRALRAKQLVEHSSYGEVKLTEEGRRVATSVNERFELLRTFFSKLLKLDEETADREACEIEHVVGEDTLGRLAAFVDWTTKQGEDVKDCLSRFHEYLSVLLGGDSERARMLISGHATDKPVDPAKSA